VDLKNRNALITGASSGIGRAIAIALAQQGSNVIINFRSNEDLAKEVLAECNKYSKKNIAVRADITKENEVKEMFGKIKKDFGNLDILINNAGIYDGGDNLTNIEVFEKLWENNFLAQVRVTKYALEMMKKGKIINITSIHGRLGHGPRGATGYGALKAAFDHYTKNLAKNLAPDIIVNAIAPGKTLTPIWGDITKEEEKEYAQDHLIKRFITPDEIADGVIFILKNDAVCGEILTIDGGMGIKTFN